MNHRQIRALLRWRVQRIDTRRRPDGHTEHRVVVFGALTAQERRDLASRFYGARFPGKAEVRWSTDPTKPPGWFAPAKPLPLEETPIWGKRKR